MRTSMMVLASLLLLLVLATTAHGIRLDRQLHEALNNKELAGDPKAGQPPNGVVAHSASSKPCASDGNCSGKAKKPLSPPAHAEPGASEKHQIPPKKNDDDGDAESRQGAEVKWSRRTLPRRPQHEERTYPDLVDIAGMDYSPAARKPPIHN